MLRMIIYLYAKKMLGHLSERDYIKAKTQLHMNEINKLDKKLRQNLLNRSEPNVRSSGSHHPFH